jgi:GAF domain-containing protein
MSTDPAERGPAGFIGLGGAAGWLRPTRPADTEAPRREQRLRQLGEGHAPDEQFDAIARSLAEQAAQLTGAGELPFAMVNFITGERQYFSGLFVPEATPAAAAASISTAVKVGRTMPLDHGWCPHVIVRRTAFPLRDVCAYPRFAGNPVTTKVGIRSYLGAPMIEDHTGIALGTICVVAREPLGWGHAGVELIKARAAEVLDLINRRHPNTAAETPPGPGPGPFDDPRAG